MGTSRLVRNLGIGALGVIAAVVIACSGASSDDVASTNGGGLSGEDGSVDVFDTGYDEFLEKIGWEDEGQGNGAQKRPITRSNYNEKKERDKAERREKARLEKLEAQIIKSEAALKKYNEQLVLEANRNNLNQMRELSVKISQVKQEIEDLYSQYAE